MVIGGLADLLVVYIFLFLVSTIPLVYIRKKIKRKQGEAPQDGSIEKEEVAEPKPKEDEARPSTTTKEQGSFNYNVFISFRGEDTRNGFTSHLHKELDEGHGITTFIDSAGMEAGQRISYLFKIIEESEIFVPVFSKNYADSKWCLREITKMVEINKREGKKRPIIPIFYDVPPSDVRHSRASFEEAFKKHRSDKELGEEQVNEWRAALTEAANISGYCLTQTEGNEAKLITLIGKHVSRILSEVPFDTEQFVGIIPQINILKKMLDTKTDRVCMIGICGLGGIGKTTLAMSLYNELYPTFKGSCFLSDIRENENRYGLPSLISKLMKGVLKKEVSIDNVGQGVTLMKQRLGSKKVLLVLDDVDHTRQLEAFTANNEKKEELFAAGSKIIVTTRSKDVLLRYGLQEEKIYNPKELDTQQSLQLFLCHASSSKPLLAELGNLPLKIVKVAGGLPLALIVFGSHFSFLKKKQEWEEMLEVLKKDQHKDVHEKLKVSYEGLTHSEKCVFLDIACFFIGWFPLYPASMWEACGHSPQMTLKVLQHKSLIKLHHGRIKMHDQIRDMGRMIVKEEGNFDPLKYSRPWSMNQLIEVLRDAKVSLGNCHVQAINFWRLPYGEKVEISWKVIAAMPKLRMISGARGDAFEDGEIHLPHNIRWFFWNCCPYEMLKFHNSQHGQLCVLILHGALFRNFGLHSMVLPKLKVLDLSFCENLVRTPDFTHLPSLVVIVLSFCTSLTEIDESIGHLKKLQQLHMHECRKLEALPDGFCKLTSLERLILFGCKLILGLPERMGDLKRLYDINLEGTTISYIPDSIGMLQRLKKLNLRGCKRIKELPEQIMDCKFLQNLNFEGTGVPCIPESIGRLQLLERLNFHGCERIHDLPEQIGELKSLRDLDLSRTSISSLPDFIAVLQSLERLDLHGCSSLRNISDSIGSLKNLTHLYLVDCKSLKELPNSMGSLTTLQNLDIRNCESLAEIPDSLEELNNMIGLPLNGCISLEKTPSWIRISSIGTFYKIDDFRMNGFKLLRRLPDSLGDLKKVRVLSLRDCESLEEIPYSIGRLEAVEELDLFGCTSLKRVPESIGNLKSLKRLSPCYCQSLEELPGTIGRLESLEELDLLGCTALKRMPETIGNLKMLKRLSLKHCQSVEGLPESIGKLKSLEDLDLHGSTLLKRIPESIGNLRSLKRLSLNLCQSLEELPESIGSFECLKMLSICCGTSIKKVPDFIGKLKNLQRLHLGKNIEEISGLISGLSRLKMICIRDCPKLKSLPLLPSSLVRLKVQGCSAFVRLPSLSNLNELKELSVVGCKALADSSSGFSNLESLKELRLTSSDGLGRDLMDKLSQASFDQLEQLFISGVSDGSSLMFGLPKGVPVHVVCGLISLTEELPSKSHVCICVQVEVEGKIVTESRWEAQKINEDVFEKELEKLGVEGRVSYVIEIKEQEEIIKHLNEGQATLRIPTTYRDYQLKMAYFGCRRMS